MTPPPRPDEFALIAELFAPLAASEAGALGLGDDAALVRAAAGAELVATTDVVVAGVHFRQDDPPGAVAQKALRVNLSDLAAMGATARYYLMTLAIPDALDMAWLRAFTAGLAADQAAFAVTLIGGDTTATPGPLTISVTALGEVPAGRALKRSGARAGDVVFVSGTIGDAALGLACLDGRIADASPDDAAMLADRFLLPLPRLQLGEGLRGLAHAAADVSDGLVADLGHICAASGLAAEIEAGRVPLSPASRRLIAADPRLLAEALTGGDDYELVFTVPPAGRDGVAALARSLDLPLSEIGRMAGGAGVVVRDDAGAKLEFGRPGYRHF